MMKFGVFRKAGAAALVVSALSGLGAPASFAEPKAVIELFTSQGCSSCPPADRLATELSKSDDFVVLTLPVDYWDYLGWKDTLARPENTARQKAYSQVMGNSGVYTPQVVVNGREHVVGSDARGIDISVKRQSNRFGGLAVPVSMTADKDVLSIHISEAAGSAAEQINGKMAKLWLVQYDHSHEVPIGRGENSGRTVTYSNVVRTMQPIGMWKGGEKRVDLPKDEFLKDGRSGSAVLVQLEASGRPGPIIGAAKMEMADR